MDVQTIVQAVDHTLLKVESTWEDIKVICDDALQYEVASICIPPSFVKDAVDYLDGQTAVCTVIGFPNGYSRTNIKVEETKQALLDGASEIDMVINVGDLKARNYAKVLAEIKAIKETCGDKILKVIIETCLLTKEEIIKMCQIVTESGADFIKTSTGFSTAGARFEDVKTMADHVGSNVRVKAAGGISSLADAEKFLELGASRLGTSRIVKILKEEK
ncbi:MAG TPA: deoxyribose-phosphate aldolase [Candidatus Eisenbacteria bacterium]|nr:deoxyribose-phosphate aldolase [Candidatus Eisenbacteria bacterium]